MKYCILLTVLFSFSFRGNSQCDPAFTVFKNEAELTFYASVTDADLEHTWNFGDGSFPIASGATVTHKFMVPGSYLISHVVASKSTGCIDSVTSEVDVNFQLTCDAEFTITRDSVYPRKYMLLPKTINGVPTSYEWRLDGKVIGSESPLIVTLPEGDHEICLNVAVINCEASTCKSLSVPLSGNCNWHASFTATPDASNSRKMRFDPNVSLPSMKFRWYFGDALFSTVPAPTFEFPGAGEYKVRLHITDTIANCFDTASMMVTIPMLPSDLCTTGFTSAADPADRFRISFSAISNQEIIRQTWHFISADSSHAGIVNDFNPTYHFPDTGSYYVQLETVTATGCKGFSWNYVQITGVPTASNAMLTPNPVYGSQMRIRLDFKKPETVVIAVFNSSGNRVYTTRHMAMTGINQLLIPVEKLQRGLYYINITGAFTKSKNTFIKM